MAEAVLAVDIGGTKTLVGLAVDGRIVAEQRAPTDTGHGGDGVAATAYELAAALAGRAGITPRAAAVAVPGVIDRGTGTVHAAANLPLDGYPLGPALAERLGVPVRLEVDANCGLLGEVAYGAARGHDDAVYVTVSTGIGMGVLSGGRLVVGGNGVAGEVGHVQVVPAGRHCGCGNDGCLEAYASGPALAQLTGRASAEDAVRAAAEGDPQCLAVVERAVGLTAGVLGAVRRLLDPTVVVLGGGVLTSGWLRGRMLAAVADTRRSWPAPCEVAAAELGERGTLLGALTLAEQP